MGKVFTGSNIVRSLLTRFPTDERSTEKETKGRDIYVTTLVDYKIKSFEKRVARDKSL